MSTYLPSGLADEQRGGKGVGEATKHKVSNFYNHGIVPWVVEVRNEELEEGLQGVFVAV